MLISNQEEIKEFLKTVKPIDSPLQLKVCFWCEKPASSKQCRMSEALSSSHSEDCHVLILPSSSEETRKKYAKLKR